MRFTILLAILVYVSSVFGTPNVYTSSTPSSCVCLLPEDQGSCNNPQKPMKMCSKFTNKQDCEGSVKLQGRSVCVWRDRTTQNVLANHGKEFDHPEVIEVIPGKLHVGIGFGLANSVILEGTDGVVIVDTLESVEAATALKTALTPLLSVKPVKAVIYLHAHSDHLQGVAVFAPAGSGIPIYAQQSAIDEVVSASLLSSAIYIRSMRQFGTYLTGGPNGFLNSGIGPFLDYNQNKTSGYRAPTNTFTGTLNVNISDIEIQLLAAPGETADQVNLYLPAFNALIIADNFYKAFPNLYAIRGTKPRDARFWYQSIDRALDFAPEYIIGTHLRPVVGAANIKQVLTNYRDAIQYLYDQTRKHMNLGVNLEDIVDKVKLPSYLAQDPYLAEMYGEISFHVKSIFINELGWFGGSAVDLNPLNPLARARRLIDLARTTRRCYESIRNAFAENTREGDQWALELSHAMLLVNPSDIRAKTYKIQALTNLGIRSPSSNARNYYLTEAEVLKGNAQEATSLTPVNAANGVLQNPVSFLLENLSMRMNHNKTDNVNFNVLFRFTDTLHYTFRIRRHVGEVRSWSPNTAPSWSYNLVVICPSAVFKGSVLQPTNIPTFIGNGALNFVPAAPAGAQLFGLFLNYFS